jgi:hypothetical protein
MKQLEANRMGILSFLTLTTCFITSILFFNKGNHLCQSKSVG